jgi:GT2 family glycosyltransferase
MLDVGCFPIFPRRMNPTRKPKIVLLGFMSHFPVAGVAWQTVHYLIGLQKLGCDVFYVEAHGCTPSKLMRDDKDDGPARAAEYIAGVMTRFGLQNNWAYHAIYDSRWFGLTETQLKNLYRDAALIINLHGSHLPTEELTATNRLVFLETDPVDLQIEVFNSKKEALDYLKPHCAFFTFGENLGAPDCLVPKPAQFNFIPTRQPVVMEFWEQHGHGVGDAFTTIGNWRQPWREVIFNGETLRWSKHFEFEKFITLPQKFPQQPFELALSSYNDDDQKTLEQHGWRVRPGLGVSQDLDSYRNYIGGSRGEFTVAKEQNIRLRSGWFSDRAVTYLAAGRPVVTQDTAFGNIFPTGNGLFSFSTMDELCAAVETINGDYEKHRRAARELAHEFFSHEVVLGKILRALGIGTPGTVPARRDGRDTNEPRQCSALPGDLILTPISRWPTRLPEQTIQTALALSTPRFNSKFKTQNSKIASIILITHNGLAYTKLCLTTLLADWRDGDELIVVDNASTDGTVEFLSALGVPPLGGAHTHDARPPEGGTPNSFIRVILNEKNHGFASANNQALKIARGDILILLNNDTLVLPGWRDGLLAHLQNSEVGLVGPVTNRTCNAAQIDAPYRTFAELEKFASDRTRRFGTPHQLELPMLAMFCVAMRREVFEKVGALDEQFAVGMFEDDDYSRRVRAAGYKIICAENIFVHHFGQASFGELCNNGEYDRVFESNRERFEKKWGVKWQPHARRLTPEYAALRERVRTAAAQLPTSAHILVVSKGDDALVNFSPQRGAHFPQAADGSYANVYPAGSTEAVTHLEKLRAAGANYFILPQPAFWWLEHYAGLREHLEKTAVVKLRDEATCIIYELGGERD